MVEQEEKFLLRFRMGHLLLLQLHRMIRAPKLSGMYRSKEAPRYAAQYDGDLFHKYTYLVTYFSNSYEGKRYLDLPLSEEKIVLLTPSGYYQEIGNGEYRFTCYSGPLFHWALNHALVKIDFLSLYIKDFQEAYRLLKYYTGILDNPIDIPRYAFLNL